MSLPSTANGRVVAISVSDRKGIKKHNLDEAELLVEDGLADDAYAGSWHRQVSLLSAESIAKIQAKRLSVGAGDFAENITTEGICLWQLPVGTRFRIGARAVV